MTFKPAIQAVRVNSAGLTRCGSDWKLDATRTRAWPDFDLWVLVSGEATARTPAGVIPLRPGSCLVMRGGWDYEIVRTASKPLANYWVHFDYLDHGDRPLSMDSVTLPWQHRQLRSTDLVFTLLARVVAAMQGGDREHASAWLATALIELEDPLPLAAPAKAQAWITDFCANVRSAPQRRHSVQQLATAAGYDPAYVCRLFKQHVGASPKQFITDVRMDAARAFLLESAMPVASIAAAVGYANCGFFSRHFKQAHGVSPSEYRGRSERG